MSEDKTIRTLRTQAWERAKGEMNSMLHTFWNENEQCEALQSAIDEFIEKVEENALQE